MRTQRFLYERRQEESASSEYQPPVNGFSDYMVNRRGMRRAPSAIQADRENSLKRAILLGQQDGLEVHVTEERGRSVFSTKTFARGDFVIEYGGHLLTKRQAEYKERKYSREGNLGCYMLYFKHGNRKYCVDATAESDQMCCLISHSRRANLAIKVVEINNVPHVALIANKDIAPGDELFVDYGDRRQEILELYPWLCN